MEIKDILESGKEFVEKNWIPILLLLFIITFSVQIRLANTNDNVLTAVDPYAYLRYGEILLENNFMPIQWDENRFFPPGISTQGVWWVWSYVIAFWYEISLLFDPAATLIQTTHYLPAYFYILVVVVSFLLGREVTGSKYGGLLTALFLSTSPMILGRTMAGFADNDVLVFFLSYLVALTTIRLYKKQSMPNYALAILSYFVFALSWGVAWWVFYVFCVSVALIVVVRLVLGKLSRKELIEMIKPLLIVGIVASALVMPINGNHVIKSLQAGLSYTGQQLIVFQSIAELTPIKLDSAGLNQIFESTGFSMYISYTFPLVMIYLLWKRRTLGVGEVFIAVWFLSTLYLISMGNRYILLFSLANAVMASFVLVKAYEAIRARIEDENSGMIFKSLYAGAIIFVCFLMLNVATSMAESNKNAGLSQNWVDALTYMEGITSGKRVMIATYWDPGHYINYYGDFHSMFDGGQSDRDFWNHDVRISDSGKMFATSNETVALQLLKKYSGMDEETCEMARQHYRETFGMEFPDDACEPVDEVYLLSSADLIHKFTWLSYFGGYYDRSFRYTPSDAYDFASHPGLCQTRDGTWVWCMWNMNMNPEGDFVMMQGYSFTMDERDNATLPIYLTPVNAYIVNEVVVNNQIFNFTDYNPDANHIGGRLMIMGGSAVYLPDAVKDSVFARTFFFGGDGLEHFELVYTNPEMSIYRVNFENGEDR